MRQERQGTGLFEPPRTKYVSTLSQTASQARELYLTLIASASPRKLSLDRSSLIATHPDNYEESPRFQILERAWEISRNPGLKRSAQSRWHETRGNYQELVKAETRKLKDREEVCDFLRSMALTRFGLTDVEWRVLFALATNKREVVLNEDLYGLFGQILPEEANKRLERTVNLVESKLRGKWEGCFRKTVTSEGKPGLIMESACMLPKGIEQSGRMFGRVCWRVKKTGLEFGLTPIEANILQALYVELGNLVLTATLIGKSGIVGERKQKTLNVHVGRLSGKLRKISGEAEHKFISSKHGVGYTLVGDLPLEPVVLETPYIPDVDSTPLLPESRLSESCGELRSQDFTRAEWALVKELATAADHGSAVPREALELAVENATRKLIKTKAGMSRRVDVHIGRIREKLGKRYGNIFIKSIRRRRGASGGYMLIEDDKQKV